MVPGDPHGSVSSDPIEKGGEDVAGGHWVHPRDHPFDGKPNAHLAWMQDIHDRVDARWTYAG